MLRKAADEGIAVPAEASAHIALSDKEISLVQNLAAFLDVVAEAGKQFSPALIANYTYDLVKEYNQFYHDFSILRESDAEVKAFRLLLSAQVARVVRTAMSLLGIQVPDRM